jgi:hypothetical protein
MVTMNWRATPEVMCYRAARAMTGYGATLETIR